MSTESHRGHWAVVVPMANEELHFDPFIERMNAVLGLLGPGKVFLVVDTASVDRTYDRCRELEQQNDRYQTVWCPQNRHVVDAYLNGMRAAYDAGYGIIIEMDAGLSHDPRAIPAFLNILSEGYECVFGSRFIAGGSVTGSSVTRRFLSKAGTILSNALLGTNLKDMTSGFQGFRREIIGMILEVPIRSSAHFYQTELRYLLRNKKITEIPIHYNAPSPRVSLRSIRNALSTLTYYFLRRITARSVEL